MEWLQAKRKIVAEIERQRKITGSVPGLEKTLTDFELKILAILGDSFYKRVGIEEVGVSITFFSFSIRYF